MRLQVVFDERRLKSLQKKLGPDLVLPPVGQLIRTLSELAQREAASRAPSALASSIERVSVSTLAAKVTVAGAGVGAMEAGRKPLVAGGKFPPPSAYAYITSDRGAQFAIARAVATRGTKGRFFMKKAKAAAFRALPRVIKDAAAAIERRWESEDLAAAFARES